MAKIGAKYPCFLPKEKDEGVVIGRLVSANLTINFASGDMYADDLMAEQVSEFASGSLAMETDDLTDENASIIYGSTVKDKLLTDNIGDTAPRGSLTYYQTLRRSGKPVFRARYYPEARATLGNDNAQTRAGSVSFQSTSTTFTIFAADNGDWRMTETFDKEAEAIAWCQEKCKIAVTPPAEG